MPQLDLSTFYLQSFLTFFSLFYCYFFINFIFLPETVLGLKIRSIYRTQKSNEFFLQMYCYKKVTMVYKVYFNFLLKILLKHFSYVKNKV